MCEIWARGLMVYTYICMYIRIYVYEFMNTYIYMFMNMCTHILTCVVCAQIPRCVFESVHYEREDATVGNWRACLWASVDSHAVYAWENQWRSCAICRAPQSALWVITIIRWRIQAHTFLFTCILARLWSLWCPCPTGAVAAAWASFGSRTPYSWNCLVLWGYPPPFAAVGG